MGDRDSVRRAIAAQEALRGDVPDEVIDVTIMALRAQLDGEPTTGAVDRRRQATVLFADVAGFTAMSEEVDPEVVAGLMNELWTRLDATIRRHGGRVDKHIGDSVMGVWGAPVAREDDPERAVRAALSIRDEFEAFRTAHELEVDVRVGVNTGPVVFGEVGTAGEVSVTGDAVNVASRIEGTAPTGGLAISHDTYRHVRGVFDVLPRDPIEVKGKSRPVRTYVVERTKRRAFRVPSRGVEGVETPMVGRDVELGELQQAFLEACRHSTARLVSVVGEAGAGKSRLLYEFTEWLDLRPESIYHYKGRSVPDTRLTPRGLMRELFATRLEVFDDDDRGTVERKLHAGLPPLTDRQADVVGHWLGFDLIHSQAVRDLAGSPDFGTIAGAHLTDHLRAVLSEAPAVLLLEDVHWADPDSLDIVEQLLEALRDTPLTVISAARPSLFEHCPDWGSGPGEPRSIRLEALADADCRALVHEIFQLADEVPDQLVELVVERAGGNPFHAEELVKMLVDDDVILVDGERWIVQSERLDGIAVPPTLTGVMQARLDGLAREELTMLQHASVIGRTFWDDAVVALLDDTDGGTTSLGTATGLRSSLDIARDRELVRYHARSTFGGCHEFAFKHALLRDATYETVLLRDRARLHRVAANWLERRAGERLGEHVGLLVEHLSRAGELERAADLLHEAGRRARASGSIRAATSFYERSLDLRSELGDGHDAVATATRIRLGDVLCECNRHDDARQVFRDAARDAGRLADEPLLADALASMFRAAAARGDYARALSMLERVQTISERQGGEPLARYLDGAAHLLIHGPDRDLVLAVGHAARSIEIWRDLDDPVNELSTINTAAMACDEAGDWERAMRWLDEGLALARRIGDTSSEERLLMNQAVIAHQRARSNPAGYAETLELYQASIERRRRLQLPHAMSLANLAQAEIECGQFDKGASDAAAALQDAWEHHDPPVWEMCLIVFAQLEIARGRLDAGLAVLGTLLAVRGTPSLVDEINSVLDFYDVDRASAVRAMDTTQGADLDALVRRLLGDDQTGTASR